MREGEGRPEPESELEEFGKRIGMRPGLRGKDLNIGMLLSSVELPAYARSA